MSKKKVRRKPLPLIRAGEEVDHSTPFQAALPFLTTAMRRIIYREVYHDEMDWETITFGEVRARIERGLALGKGIAGWGKKSGDLWDKLCAIIDAKWGPPEQQLTFPWASDFPALLREQSLREIGVIDDKPFYRIKVPLTIHTDGQALEIEEGSLIQFGKEFFLVYRDRQVEKYGIATMHIQGVTAPSAEAIALEEHPYN